MYGLSNITLTSLFKKWLKRLYLYWWYNRSYSPKLSYLCLLQQIDRVRLNIDNYLGDRNDLLDRLCCIDWMCLSVLHIGIELGGRGEGGSLGWATQGRKAPPSPEDLAWHTSRKTRIWGSLLHSCRYFYGDRSPLLPRLQDDKTLKS